MTLYRAGQTIEYRVTWLEMDKRPGFGWPPMPVGRDALLVHADTPPWWWFRALYDAVGRDYAWTDQHALGPAETEAWIQHPEVSLYTLMGKGWPQGFFMLDGREDGVCDLAYFGLVPEAVGIGLGTWLLKTAILTGWDRPGTQKLTVNTCTLDHPRALQQYQRLGFAPVRTEVRSRRLTQDFTATQPLT